jgi:hypothetical protein
MVAAAAAVRNLPPHNPDATTAETAYPMAEVIPPALSPLLNVAPLLAAGDPGPDGVAKLAELRTQGMVSSAPNLSAAIGNMGLVRLACSA